VPSIKGTGFRLPPERRNKKNLEPPAAKNDENIKKCRQRLKSAPFVSSRITVVCYCSLTTVLWHRGLVVRTIAVLRVLVFVSQLGGAAGHLASCGIAGFNGRIFVKAGCAQAPAFKGERGTHLRRGVRENRMGSFARIMLKTRLPQPLTCQESRTII